MMTKKKRKMIMIGIPVLVVILLIVILIVLYLNTDLFKSDQTLFFKYFGKNAENLLEIDEVFNDEQYNNFLNSEKYSKNSEFNINYTENYETTSEKRDNSINNLKLTLQEELDKDNNYRYGSINLLNKEKSCAKIEYVKKDNIYGIGIQELFKQYILVENDNLNEVLSKYINTEYLDNIPNEIDMDKIRELKFSEEELEKLKSKYIKLVSEKISKDKFSKETNQKLIINEHSIFANEFKLSLTREQINNIFLDILQTIKEEEIILNKIEKIQSIIPENLMNESTNDLKQMYTSEIEEIIEEINRTNIGTDEINIIVYESKGVTLKTAIKTEKTEIEFNYLNDSEEKYADILISENEKPKQKLILKQKNNDIDFSINNYIDGELQTITFKVNNEINDEDAKRRISVIYIYDMNKVELNYSEEIKVLEQLEEIKEFDEKNSVNISELESEKAEQVTSKAIQAILEKLTTLAEEINIKDIQIMLKNIGVISEENNFNENETSEVQKKRFNSALEILQGEELEGERILKIIDVIGKSITNLQIVSNLELRIELNMNNGNEEFTKVLKKFLQDNKSRKYSVSVEYDNETGLVNNLMLTLLERGN